MLFKSLKSRILFFSIFIVTFSLLITNLVIQFKVEKTLSKSLENNALNLLETIKVNIDGEYKNIQQHNNTIIDRRKHELKNHIDIIFGMIQTYENKIKSGELTQAQAQKIIIQTIGNVDFEEGVGYFWINNTDLPYSKMIYHKTIPSLNGNILDDPLYNNVLETQENLFTKMTEECLAHGDAFVKYLWPKPLENGLTQPQEKLSYVRLYKPWNWIIGTGVYMDDIPTETARKIQTVVDNLNKTISRQMVSESGYCFIFGDDNYMYVHPYLANRSGNDLINPTTSNRILNDIKSTYEGGTKYMEYYWNKIDDRENYIYPKKIFITKFEPLNWYICVSVYKYDFKRDIRELSSIIFIFTMIFIAGAALLAFVVSNSITKPLNTLIEDLKYTDKYGIPKILKKHSKTNEIQSLTNTINNMIISIQGSRAELKNERDFSMGIIDGSPDIICGFRKTGEIIFINKAGVQHTGYSFDEITQKKWFDLIIDTEIYTRAQIIEKILNDDQRNLEIYLMKKNGDRLVLLWNSIPFTGKTDKDVDIIANCMDITERKEAENKLEFFKNYLAKIINALSSVIIGIDEDGIITQWNDSAVDLFDRNQMDGTSIFDFDYDLGISKELISQLIKKQDIHTISKQNFNIDGRFYYLEITIYPLIYDQYKGAVIRIDDISDKVKMEEMMVHSEKMISIGGLAAGMAHEINNPIAGMLQNALVLKNKLTLDFDKNIEVANEIGLDLNKMEQYLLARNIDKHLDLIKQSGSRAAEIVLNMLSFARKSDSQFNRVKIDDILDDTLNILANDYHVHKKYDFQKITVEKHYAENLPQIRVEESKLQQVFMNILKNGAEAIFQNIETIKEPKINIRIEDYSKIIRIEINNNGPMIPLEIRKRIFEPFFTTKPTGEGTGLGLSVSYFIITRNHKGKMWVESDKLDGTTFFIELPIV